MTVAVAKARLPVTIAAAQGPTRWNPAPGGWSRTWPFSRFRTLRVVDFAGIVSAGRRDPDWDRLGANQPPSAGGATFCAGAQEVSEAGTRSTTAANHRPI